MKKVISLALACLLVLSTVAACGSPAASAPAATEAAAEAKAEEGKKLVIGYATKSATNVGFKITNDGVVQAAEDLGVELKMVGPAKDQDVAGQLQVIEDFVNSKVDALIIAAADSAAVVPGVEMANEAGIPVIAIDTAINGGEIASYITTDNYYAASLAADYMAEKLGGKGKVALVNGVLAQSVGYERRDGFAETIEKKYPDIEIAFEINTEWSAEKAMTGMEDAITAVPDLDGVFSAWDGGTVTIVPVIEEAGLQDQITVVGFDADPNGCKFLQEGRIAGDVAQYLYKIGYEGAVQAVKAAKGESVEAVVDTGTEVVTPENVDKYIEENGLTEYMPKD